MKNIRKIVAILAAALMLCSVLPISAFAASGDVAVDLNFDDGSNGGFERSYNENGYIVFDATTADWQNTYAYLNLKANTDYVVSFSAKANKDANLAFKINNSWVGDTVKESVAVTTDWQDYEFTVNSGELTSAIVMFASDYPAGSAPIYCIDNLKIAEYVEPAVPGKIVNGDFETGEANGWNLPQQGGVSAEAAHDGSYGVNIKGNGGWGGMLDQTIPVNAGKAYEITFWLKINATGVNVQIKDGNTSGANIAGEWVDMGKAGDWKQFTYIVRPTSDLLTINFCGSGSAAEDAYVDTVTVTELIDPSFDGYLYNGDFETGKTDSWESVWGSAQISIVEGRNGGSAMLVNAGQWNVVRQKVSVQPNTDYVVKAYGKNANNMTLLVKDSGDTTNIAQTGFASSEDFKASSLVFNSGSYSEVYICFMGNVAGSSVIVDDVMMWEKVDASNDGYLINGTFETGDINPWDNLWGSCPKAEVIKGGKDDNFALEIISGLWKHVRQTNIAVEPNTDYKITVWAKNSKGMSLLVKDGADSKDLKNVGLDAGDEWTQFTNEFNSGDYTSVIVSFMGNAEDCYGIFDNIVMEKVVPACEHEYDNACDVDCNLCYEPREVQHSVQHVEAVAATCTAMGNIEYWYCDVCGMAWLDADCTMNTNLRAVVLPMADHTYADCLDVDCDVCGAVREATGHNLTYFEAVVATNCQETSHDEYWYCENCGCYFGDAEASWQHNPAWLFTPGDCVRPEGAADCAIVPCEVCGNDVYGYGEHDVLTCQGGICSKCNAEIEGVGCQNYDTPACEDGVCYYCGGFVAGFGHENGATAPCVDGECAYGCGLTYPATEDHVDADGDDYCDNCWNHLACIDEDGDGWCDVCWSEMPVADIIYGDANGDNEINTIDLALMQQYLANWTVEFSAAAADANGDGEINTIDLALMQQYLAGWEVTLGG